MSRETELGPPAPGLHELGAAKPAHLHPREHLGESPARVQQSRDRPNHNIFVPIPFVSRCVVVFCDSLKAIRVHHFKSFFIDLLWSQRPGFLLISRLSAPICFRYQYMAFLVLVSPEGLTCYLSNSVTPRVLGYSWSLPPLTTLRGAPRW